MRHRDLDNKLSTFPFSAIMKFFILVFLFLGCKPQNSFDKRLDVSRNFICCDSSKNNFSINDISIQNKNTLKIQLCEENSNYLNRIILIHFDEKRELYDVTWDLIVINNITNIEVNSKKIDHNNFRGDFKAIDKLSNGNYRLVLLGEDIHCGEVKFSITNQDDIDIESFCISECI